MAPHTFRKLKLGQQNEWKRGYLEPRMGNHNASQCRTSLSLELELEFLWFIKRPILTYMGHVFLICVSS